MIAKEDVMTYEDKIANTLKVYEEVEDAWRQGKFSTEQLNRLSDILDEYTDLIEEKL